MIKHKLKKKQKKTILVYASIFFIVLDMGNS